MRDRCCGLEDEPRLWLINFNWSNVPFALGSGLSFPLSSPLLSTLTPSTVSPVLTPCPRQGRLGTRLNWQLLPQQRQQDQLSFATCNPSLWN